MAHSPQENALSYTHAGAGRVSRGHITKHNLHTRHHESVDKPSNANRADGDLQLGMAKGHSGYERVLDTPVFNWL